MAKKPFQVVEVNLKDGINYCLQCGAKHDPEAGKPLVRGICPTDIQRVNREKNRLKKIDPNLADEFETVLIKKKLLLPSKRPGRTPETDVYAKIAEELLEKRLPAEQYSEIKEAERKKQEEFDSMWGLRDPPPTLSPAEQRAHDKSVENAEKAKKKNKNNS